MGCVYVVTNKINQKQYVGKSTFSLPARRKNHEVAAKRGCPYHLHRAIRKYGADNFDWKIVQDNVPLVFLGILEVLWIAKL